MFVRNFNTKIGTDHGKALKIKGCNKQGHVITAYPNKIKGD